MMPNNALLFALSAVVVNSVWSGHTWAADLADSRASVEAGRKALSKEWDYPWYDATNDGTGVVTLKEPIEWSFFDWLGDLFAGVNLDLGNLLVVFAWVAIAVLLGIIAYLLIRAYLLQEASHLDASSLDSEEDPFDRQRVEALPVAVDRTIVDLLAESRRLYQAGDLSGAIVYLFSHQLVSLDRHDLLRLVKGKTNRQYLRELRRRANDRPELPSLLERTMLLFEAAFFGKQAPAEQQFRACWDGLERFDALLVSSPGDAP